MLNTINRYFEKAGQWRIILAGLLLMSLIGTVDYLTGSEISFSIFYLLPILFVSWYGKNVAGYFSCIMSAGVWFWVDRLVGNSYSHFLIPYWNAFVRLGFFITTAYLLCGIKAHLRREQQLARLDTLTGLLNARVFREQAAAIISAAKRYKHPLVLAYIDVDYFKQVNDTLGHSEGDRVLRMVGQTLKHSLRHTDVIGRQGGDEFAVVLPETGVHAAQTAMQHVREQLQKQAQRAQWPIGFSIGVAAFTRPPRDFDEAINMADQLMYRVKSAGRGHTAFEEFA